MKYCFSILFLFLVTALSAQPCSNPGQTVQTAFPVCGSTVFTQLNVPACTGIPTGCTVSNNNCYFYKFTVITSGTLGFLITPINSGYDYDFQLFNVTNAPSPTAIYTSNLLKTGNVSAASGNTGCTASGLNVICGSGSPFNQLQNVFAGEKYILQVENFSSGAAGYTLNFTGGTASITENLPIDFATATTNCSNDKIIIKLNRPIRCNSIATNGSDFILSPPSFAIQSAAAVACSNGQFSTDSIVLNLSGILPINTYTITVQNGSDGNTLLGFCDEQMAIGKNITFNTQTPTTAPQFLQVFPVGCTSDKIKFQLSKPVLCDSVAANGSDFEITGPSNITITAATVVCTGTPFITSEIELTLTQPISVGGTYSLKAKNGTDNNTMVDLCGLKQPLNDQINFTIVNAVDANFTYNIDFGCVKDTVFFNHPGVGVTSWSWNFDDPASGVLNTSVAQNPTHIFSSFGVKNVSLTVSNGNCIQTITKTINLDNEITSNFTISPKDSICLNTPMVFTSTATGNNLTHNWSFGNSQTASVQNPLPVIYAQLGTYTVLYKISNNFNCSITVQKSVTILPIPLADFTLSTDKICEQQSIVFTPTNINSFNKYTWNFGDGSTNNTLLNPSHTYIAEGNLMTSLVVDNLFCGTATKQIPIKVIAYPKVDLGNDLLVCTSKIITLVAGTNNTTQYLWTTAQTTPSITFNAQQTQTIKVTVTNDICISQDSVFIKVLPSCKLYVPNVFTPNADGANDIFKVLNADAVKEFNLKVYNRYGEKVFVSNNPLLGWDGTAKSKAASPGAYVWLLHYKDATTNTQLILKGTVLLIR
jgi:gliding motility-associated-like protein